MEQKTILEKQIKLLQLILMILNNISNQLDFEEALLKKYDDHELNVDDYLGNRILMQKYFRSLKKSYESHK